MVHMAHCYDRAFKVYNIALNSGFTAFVLYISVFEDIQINLNENVNFIRFAVLMRNRFSQDFV